MRQARTSRIQDTGVVQAMPRRKLTHTPSAVPVSLPMPHRVVFKPGIFRPIWRLLVWFTASLRFFSGNALDAVLGRGSIQRRAVRLRQIFEGSGVSFAKLGQQLSLRADLLPYAYCAELSRMLDNAKPFPTAQAIAIIERSLGRPLGDIFETFDPDPIGAASLACVFQAQLKSGERVAVKVRRPGIGPVLAADLRALNWLMILGETLTVIRPGQTLSFRQNLGAMLMAELNFRAEARHTEMFRLRAEKDGVDVTSPRVFFDYCTDEVLVNELVSGIWMTELVSAVDRNDQAFLAQARKMGIDPKVVASRLSHSAFRDLLEQLFFHGDPHPANLVILPNNRICFIDFGTVGRMSSQSRNTWRELQFHLRNGDIERMVACALSLAGHLPPIDVDTVMRAMEQIYADWVYAVRSTDAEWWERSTALNWFRYVNLAREYSIPVSLETIQFFRASLLYDSLVVRLHKNIDPIEEWKGYTERVGKNARRRTENHVRKRLFDGPTRNDFWQIEQIADTVSQVYFRNRRTIGEPVVQFRNILGKTAYVMSVGLRLFFVVTAVYGGALVAEFIAHRWYGRELSWFEIAEWLTSFGWLQIALLAVALVVARRILMYLREPDRNPDYGRQ
jgi:predicted unusual protein kinase regulating ubiquinone biosynthesis (AarF/ABC1/UbiB family)